MSEAKSSNKEVWNADTTPLHAEIERLRAALREIADYEYGQQAQIAREALRGAETDFKPDKVAVSIPAETKAGYAEFISDAELTSRRLRGAAEPAGSPLSDFVRASPEEKERIYKKAMERASEQQNEVVARAAGKTEESNG